MRTSIKKFLASPRLRKKSQSYRVLAGFLFVSIALNLLLAENLRKLRNSLLYLKAEMRALSDLKIDETVPSFEARDADGNPVTLSYSADKLPTIIYILSPNCLWCTRNLDNIKKLTSQTHERYRVIGISISKENLSEYISQNELPFPVYTDISPEILRIYQAIATPRTLVISPEGKIQKNWFGAFSGNLQREVEEYFDLRLPGVVETDDERQEGCTTCDKKSSSEMKKGAGDF